MSRPSIGLVARVRQTVSRTPDRVERDGRVLVTRAAIREEFGVGDSTTRKWWRDRATNDHPEPVHREGRRQWWDLAAMRRFVESGGDPGPAPMTVEHEGRVLINRPGMAERYETDQRWLAVLYHQRSTNGHPEPVRRYRRFLYFDRAATDTWHAARSVAKRSSLTPVDRSGDGDELVDITEATRVLGYTSESTIRSFLSRNPDYFPAPEHTGADGRAHWQRRTLWGFADRRSRPGRAGHARRG